MNYSIRGVNLEVTDSIREYVIQKLSRMEKYFEDPEKINVKVLISVRGREQKIEVTINANGFDLRAEVSHNDMYAATDLVIDKLETQMRKYKSKLMSKDRAKVVYPEEEYDDIEHEDVVRRKKVYLKPMDEDEAIMQMEFLGHSFYIYKDIKTERVNVLYKRYDGSYGIIETN